MLGREQGRRLPCLVISVDALNHGPADVIIVLPMTTRDRGIPIHVAVDPPEGGLRQRSFIKCEDIRSVSIERFINRWGAVASRTLTETEDRLRIILAL